MRAEFCELVRMDDHRMVENTSLIMPVQIPVAVVRHVRDCVRVGDRSDVIGERAVIRKGVGQADLHISRKALITIRACKLHAHFISVFLTGHVEDPALEPVGSAVVIVEAGIIFRKSIGLPAERKCTVLDPVCISPDKGAEIIRIFLIGSDRVISQGHIRELSVLVRHGHTLNIPAVIEERAGCARLVKDRIGRHGPAVFQLTEFTDFYTHRGTSRLLKNEKIQILLSRISHFRKKRK